MILLAKNLDEVRWADRLSPFNHVPHFPTHVTHPVDTFPLRVCQATGEIAAFMANPKYGETVFKGQIGLTMEGFICVYTGPHLGVSMTRESMMHSLSLEFY